MRPFHSGLTGRLVGVLLEKATNLVVAAITGLVAWLLWTKVRGPRSKKKAATVRRAQPQRKKKRSTKVRRKAPKAKKPAAKKRRLRKPDRKPRTRKAVARHRRAA